MDFCAGFSVFRQEIARNPPLRIAYCVWRKRASDSAMDDEIEN